MQFRLRTLLLFFVVVFSSFAAFGLGGIGVILFLGVQVIWFRRPSVRVLIILAWSLLWFLSTFVEDSARECARRGACQNNLRQIGVALLNYESAHGQFPPAYVADADGKPMHSWRVLILRELGRPDLFEAYDFNEPWNGPNNRKLAASVSPLFRCPSTGDGVSEEATTYVAVTGPGTAWPGTKGTSLKDFRDEPADTILLVEVVDSDIHWMEPRDLTLEEALAAKQGGCRIPSSHHYLGREGHFFKSHPLAGCFVTADGASDCLVDLPSRDVLSAALTIDGGEATGAGSKAFPTLAHQSLLQRLDFSRLIGFFLFVISMIWFSRHLPTPGSAGTGDVHTSQGGDGNRIPSTGIAAARSEVDSGRG